MWKPKRYKRYTTPYTGSGWWSKKTVQQFQDEITGTTSVLGRDKSVRVTFLGEKAYAKDGVVNFPNLDPTAKLDTDTVDFLRGWVDHESAKMRFSDRDFINEVTNRDLEKNPLLHDLFSTIEGVRVEGKYCDLYAGAGKNLAEMSKKTVSQAINRHEEAKRVLFGSMHSDAGGLLGDQPEQKKDERDPTKNPNLSPASIIPAALGAHGRTDFHGVYNWSSLNDVKKYLDEDKLKEWAEQIKDLTSTQEAYDLANLILDEMKQEQPENSECDKDESDKEDPNKEDGEGNSKGKGSKGDEGDGSSNDDGDDDEKNDDPDDNNSDNDDTNNEGDDEDGEGDNDKEGDSGDNPEEEHQQPDVAELEGSHEPVSTSDIVEGEMMGDPNMDFTDRNNVPYRVWSRQYDTNYHWSDNKWGSEDIQYYLDVKAGIDSSISTLKRKIELLIQATRKVDWERMKEGGRFDSKRMVGAYNAEPNVFKTREDASDLDTAVSILIDMSGSMTNPVRDKEGQYITINCEDDFENVKRRSHVAMETAILLSECMDKIGVPFTITGFDSESDKGITQRYNFFMREGQSEHHWGRTHNLNMHQFKKFNDRMFDARKHMHHIGKLKEIAGNNNLDCESVFNEAQKLIKRPEKRKILFVISDGQPVTGGNRGSQMRKLREVVKDISHQVDVVGIGVETDSVKEYYPKHVILDEGTKLPEICLNLLKEALIPESKT